MTEQYDIVIAGAGHNSLITAAYLGKAGYSCLLLEARPVIGGNTMTEELTLPEPLDLAFCRFVLLHVHSPVAVLRRMRQPGPHVETKR